MNGEAWKSWDAPKDGDGLWDWQANRCASCGYESRLVRDHCHQTGLIRGLLCHSCNNREGSDFTGSWAGWQQGDHPAAAIRSVEVYVSTLGQTPLAPDSVLNYYTRAEQKAYWSLIAERVASGEDWPTSAPWTDADTARRDAEQAQTRAAMDRLSLLITGGAA